MEKSKFIQLPSLDHPQKKKKYAITELEYNNSTFKIAVDINTLLDINADIDTRNNYAKACYEQLDLGEALQQKVKEPIVESESNDEKFIWTPKYITTLCTLRFNLDYKFIHPKSKKNKIWQKIADNLFKMSGHPVSGHVCDIKYRNLLGTYRANKKKQQASEESSVTWYSTWEYFDLFDGHFGGDEQLNTDTKPPLSIKTDIMPSTSQSESETENSESNNVFLENDHEEDEFDSAPESESPECMSPQNVTTTSTPKACKENEYTLEQYLYLKRKDDERHFKIKMEMKERLIEALLDLATLVKTNNAKKQSS